MPFTQFIDQYGIALHAGMIPGRPASHGCIRLPAKFAAKLYGVTQVGSTVMIGA
jgi:lipoprotein-anchoring transpeptidase ErfK/SrfK